jgi:hypothetical protein
MGETDELEAALCRLAISETKNELLRQKNRRLRAKVLRAHAEGLCQAEGIFGTVLRWRLLDAWENKGLLNGSVLPRAARLLNHWADGIESGRIG